jgi:hypothetical protein
MSDVAIVKADIIDLNEPALSATSDMPVIETKPDSQPEPKPAAEVVEPKAKESEVAAVDETKKPEESAPPETPDEDAAASDEPKKAKGVQKRIDELVRQREEEKAEKLRLLAIIEGQQKPKEEPKVEQDQGPQKPTRESFATTDEYVEALANYAEANASWSADQAVKKALAEQEKQVQLRQIEEGQKAAQEAYAKRVEKAVEEYPDYKASSRVSRRDGLYSYGSRHPAFRSWSEDRLSPRKESRGSQTNFSPFSSRTAHGNGFVSGETHSAGCKGRTGPTKTRGIGSAQASQNS